MFFVVNAQLQHSWDEEQVNILGLVSYINKGKCFATVSKEQSRKMYMPHMKVALSFVAVVFLNNCHYAAGCSRSPCAGWCAKLAKVSHAR